jgi:hypothetical protein
MVEQRLSSYTERVIRILGFDPEHIAGATGPTLFFDLLNRLTSNHNDDNMLRHISTSQRVASTRLTRSLSSRASAILSALDLPTDGTSEVPGVYDGAWGGSGDVLESRCPATGEILARVKTVSPPTGFSFSS